MEFLSEGDGSSVNLSAHTGIADAGVDIVGKVEYCSSLLEVQQVALWSEHVYFVFLQVGGKLVHQLQVVIVFEGRTDIGKPFVDTAFSLLDTLVAPVGSESVLCNIVHALGSDLYLYPFVFRTQHSGMQTFITVALRHAEPVAHTLWVWLIHVGDEGKGLPALHILFLSWCIEDNTDGKEVVYTLEGALLLLHLLPDRVDTLGAAFHVIFQTGSIELLLDWLDEAGDIGIARSLGGVQLVLYHIVGVVLEILQTEVFQFALQFVESQFVGEWGIEVACLFAYFMLCLFLFGITNLSHHVHAVGNHDEDDAHILRE